jgi:hypothetical protein
LATSAQDRSVPSGRFFTPALGPYLRSLAGDSLCRGPRTVSESMSLPCLLAIRNSPPPWPFLVVIGALRRYSLVPNIMSGEAALPPEAAPDGRSQIEKIIGQRGMS